MPEIGDARIGTQVAERYRLDRVIGRGGMGTVYEAVHLWTERKVAVKLLVTDQTESGSARILREARTAATVRHPNLVEVLDVGEVEPGLMYLVLELLEGESLYDHLARRDTMRPADVLDVLVPILDALEALHLSKVLHRDVKPGNIFLSLDGQGRVVPKLLDLGISKPLDGDESLTMTGALMGTPGYMSPEQARGEPEVGVTADIWAMGVVLFEALTGRRPFEAASIPGLLHKIATDRPPPIGTLAPDLPGALARAVDSALAYEAADRPASAGALGDVLVEAALDAGWPLTCRIPSGPRISLEPPAPVFDRPSGAQDPDATPMASDADGTPIAFVDMDRTPYSSPKPSALEVPATAAPASSPGASSPDASSPGASSPDASSPDASSPDASSPGAPPTSSAAGDASSESKSSATHATAGLDAGASAPASGRAPSSAPISFADTLARPPTSPVSEAPAPEALEAPLPTHSRWPVAVAVLGLGLAALGGAFYLSGDESDEGVVELAGPPDDTVEDTLPAPESQETAPVPGADAVAAGATTPEVARGEPAETATAELGTTETGTTATSEAVVPEAVAPETAGGARGAAQPTRRRRRHRRPVQAPQAVEHGTNDAPIIVD